MASPDNFRFNFSYLQMPRFYESSSEETVDKSEASEKQSGDKDMKYWRIFLILVFCYYFISCGVERIYQVLVTIIRVMMMIVMMIQPMAFTFGICGPLALSPGAAVTIDSCYNGGFMCGRLVSALVAAFIKPR